MSHDPSSTVPLPPSASSDAATHRRRWAVQSPLGLLAVGFGASLLGHATLRKGDGASTWTWVAAGTASLIALNAGLSLFGDAVKHRTLYELKADAD